MAAIAEPKLKQRPIVRLGIFLISHSLFVSIVCFTAGVLALLLLPVLAKNTYISENALMPGSANNMLSSHDASVANKLVKDLTGLKLRSRGSELESQRLVAHYMSDLGAEVTHHKFYPQLNQFHPLHFFTSPDSGNVGKNISCSSLGMNTVGIIRAPRGDGKEAIVLVTPYNPMEVGVEEAFSLGIAYSVFSLLTRATWLAKDVVWLVADSRYGEYSAVASWLTEYLAPAFSRVDVINSETCSESNIVDKLGQKRYTEKNLYDGFRRAGTMAAALVIKVAKQSDYFEDAVHIYAEASNGQMPNLDLINIVNYLAVHKQGLQIKVKKMWSVLSYRWLYTLGFMFESLGQIARSLNPQWKFGIPAAEYVEGTATLASSLYYQGLGVPTGPHGAFRDYQVDAITLEISSKVPLIKMARRNEFLIRGGKLIEGVVRSVNNLLEKFHQSFFLYLLTSPSKFVSVGVYMISFALLVAPLPIVAASLHVEASNFDSIQPKEKSASSSASEMKVNFNSWKWLKSARKVFAFHLWGGFVSVLPYFISQMPGLTSETSFIVWIVLSVLSLLVSYISLGPSFSEAAASQSQRKEWACLKSVTISAAFIGLSLTSVINFATAEIGALLIVPICLMARPLKLDIKASNLMSSTRITCNLVLGFIGFPPVTYFLLKGVFEGYSGINVGDFWEWLETLWAWNSATYLYIGLVHLPCWALCIHILFHHC
ncbi:glycosylphosphatidylinositol anchor attachment 1 protein [Neltuma alba]|uniref:glycosylphosphatidylinositol anchor attachment 1 protein n=1 Tax=Neltuma alba TaxID=207710 RepID=UPI0010A48CE5|nr:glycosylphosphatidylinositol anchor attachment 1 protein-like [Prosopis alba]